MKYQGMLQESSLALSGSSATSSKTDYLAANKTITTDPHVKHLLCLSIHPSIHHAFTTLLQTLFYDLQTYYTHLY